MSTWPNLHPLGHCWNTFRVREVFAKNLVHLGFLGWVRIFLPELSAIRFCFPSAWAVHTHKCIAPSWENGNVFFLSASISRWPLKSGVHSAQCYGWEMVPGLIRQWTFPLRRPGLLFSGTGGWSNLQAGSHRKAFVPSVAVETLHPLPVQATLQVLPRDWNHFLWLVCSPIVPFWMIVIFFTM